MSQFYGTITGNRGTVNKPGSKKSGLSAHIRGWDIGVKINCYHNIQGNDVIEILTTSGSNNPSGTLIAQLTRERGLEVF